MSRGQRGRNQKLDRLRGYLTQESGIPSHDTFGRLFGLINPEEFEAAFRRWVGAEVEREGSRPVGDAPLLCGGYAFGQLRCLHKPEQWPDLRSFAIIESERCINGIALNLIRLAPTPRKGGIKARRLIAATSDLYRAQLLGLA